MTSQVRRASVSIVANIVEGQARSSKKEFLQFLYMANASLVETEYLLELAKDLGYIQEKYYLELLNKKKEVGNLLFGLIKSIRIKNLDT